LVVFLAGPSPSASPEQAFLQSHFEHVCQKYSDPAQLAKYDTRGSYGLLGTEMIGALTVLVKKSHKAFLGSLGPSRV